jgi:D-psicose/D-tagatose/L-ribulose 3-epimerase
MFKYSVTQWIYGNEKMEISLERLKKFGYDGVELAGEPKKIDLALVQQLLKRYDLECTSICGIYTKERDLSTSNTDIRKHAVQYVKDCVDMAVVVGASTLIVVPSPVGKDRPDTTIQEEWDNVVLSLKEAGAYAESKNIQLAIEALNRFETYLVNKLADAKKLVEQVNIPSVRIMADLFHMNIEERNHSEALQHIAPYLVHVHIADNTREAAGLGMTNFKEVVQTLLDIGYKGPITMEFLPPVANPYLVAQSDKSELTSIYDQHTQQAIDHMKKINNSLSG